MKKLKELIHILAGSAALVFVRLTQNTLHRIAVLAAKENQRRVPKMARAAFYKSRAHDARVEAGEFSSGGSEHK